MKRKERGNSLIGFFVPQKWHQMRPFVKRWEPHLCGLSKGKKPEELVWLEFDFSRLYKADIYQAFLAIYAHGGIELTNEELISFLASYTNLGSEASIKTLFYRYKQQIHV